MSNALGTAYDIRLKLSACVERDVDTNPKCCVHAATTVNTTIAATQAKVIKVKLSMNI